LGGQISRCIYVRLILTPLGLTTQTINPDVNGTRDHVLAGPDGGWLNDPATYPKGQGVANRNGPRKNLMGAL